MTENPTGHAPSISTIRLDVVFPEQGVDSPILVISIDGGHPFEKLKPSGFQGFDPDEIVSSGLPLMASEQSTRVAVYRCICGDPGCGVVAPVISRVDDTLVAWTDFRNYTGVFMHPTDDSLQFEGRALEQTDLVFDRAQYEAEVLRVTSDRRWESDERKTARQLEARLREAQAELLPIGYELGWVSYVSWRPGARLWMVEAHAVEVDEASYEAANYQYIAELTTEIAAPEAQAADLDRQLRSVPATQWNTRFPSTRLS